MKKKLLAYVKARLSKVEFDQCMTAWEHKEPIPYEIADNIADLCEEFCEENYKPEGWWLNHFEDAEEVFRAM